MRGEGVGNSVGYRVGHGDHQDSPNSSVTFVTVGYLLQYLSHNPELIQRYTHIGEKHDNLLFYFTLSIERVCGIPVVCKQLLVREVTG